jgi:hypothetical protein
MTKRYTYCFNHEENSGYEKCDILLKHYGDDGFRTIVLRKDELERIDAWEMTKQLNNAYESGYKHAMEDLRRFIGVKE